SEQESNKGTGSHASGAPAQRGGSSSALPRGSAPQAHRPLWHGRAFIATSPRYPKRAPGSSASSRG
ncbi:unnamed protein product, partial [Closterium sp. NIES-54]